MKNLLCTACLFIACLLKNPCQASLTSDTLSIPSSNIKRSMGKKQNAIYTITFWEVRALAQTSVFWWEEVLMTFRMNPQDTTMRRSENCPSQWYSHVFGGLNIMEALNFSSRMTSSIFGQFSFKNNSGENFYGVGYSTNKNMCAAIRPASTGTAVYR